MKNPLRTFLLVAMLSTPFAPGRANMPVIDISNIVQGIMNSADQIRQWNQYLTTYREGFALSYAIVQGIRDWRSMSWSDILSVFEMPWFDGIDGIEDIRNLAGASGMTLDELQYTFNEVDKIHRMMTNPMYLQNQAFQAKCRLWATVYARVVKRRVALTKMHQKYLAQIKAWNGQAKTIQHDIEAMAGEDPVPTAKIALLQTKLTLINAQIAGNKEAIAAQNKIIKMQEEQEKEDTLNKVGKLDDANSTGNFYRNQ